MKAQDLDLMELVEFSDGRIDLHGRRLTLHSSDVFGQFRKDLVQMAGVDAARRALTRFGYFWGQADAAAMKRIFEWDSLEEWLKAGPRMHALQGVAQAAVKTLDVDEATGRFRMEVTWRGSVEAEEQKMALGRAAAPMCWTTTGYASGYASFCMGRPVYFIERKCRMKGDRFCSAEGRDQASWGKAIESHIVHFQADDIRGHVLRLTRELKEKMKEMARQRRRIERLEHGAVATPVEVHSAAYRRVLDMATRVARYDVSVVLFGESGSGKEVLARHIHRMSPRSKGPFVTVNCGAIPETLLESELFGHKAGAFTGAVGDRVGLFEEAEGGAIFLDEIGDISPAMQTKLLRTLQEKEVVRVGENRPRRVDMRVLAATHRDIRQAVRDGTFREDLYYRLGVVEIETPPLRARREDIVSLARHFVAKTAKRFALPNLRLDATALDAMIAYDWPGNVRELENVVERAAALSRDGVIRPADLPFARARRDAHGVVGAQTLKDVEHRHIRDVLASVNGSRTRAAKALGIGQATLWRKLKANPAIEY